MIIWVDRWGRMVRNGNDSMERYLIFEPWDMRFLDIALQGQGKGKGKGKDE